MATSIDAVSSDKLEALLQCSICLEALDNPRTLPCFHSYCKCCLERFVNNIRQNKPGADLQCPFCRSEFTLGQEGVEGMTSNHFICNMLEVMAVQDRVKGIPCSHCQKPSVGRCVTCEIFMCDKCFQPHNSYPGFRDHCVLTMDELSKHENRSKITGSSYCKEHKNKKLKFFCETCEKLICRRCMDFGHLRPEHVCSPLENVAEKKREALKMNCAILKRKLSEGNETLQELTNVAQSLEDNLGEVKRKIKKREDQILTRTRRVIERKSQSLIEEANKVFNDKQSAVVKKKQQLQTYVNTVQASADVSSSLLANGNDEDIILSQNALWANVEKAEKEYSRDVKHAYDDEILTYNSEQIDAMLIKEVVEEFGNDKAEGLQADPPPNEEAMETTKEKKRKEIKKQPLFGSKPPARNQSGPRDENRSPNSGWKEKQSDQRKPGILWETTRQPATQSPTVNQISQGLPREGQSYPSQVRSPSNQEQGPPRQSQLHSSQVQRPSNQGQGPPRQSQPPPRQSQPHSSKSQVPSSQNCFGKLDTDLWPDPTDAPGFRMSGRGYF